MRVFVVGATGAAGRPLVDALLAAGHEITAMSPGERLDQLPPAVRRLRAGLLDADLEDVLPSRLAGHDAVVNLATAVPADDDDPRGWDLDSSIRETGSPRLARLVAQVGVPVLVQLSISMIYPVRGAEWIDESVPIDSDPERAALVGPTAAMEEAVIGLPRTCSWTILRAARFVGPATIQDRQRELLRAGKLPIPGDGSTFVSHVHVADVADAVLAVLDQRPSGEILNLAAEPVTYESYLTRLARIDGAPQPAVDADLEPDLDNQRIDSGRAQRLLGWTARRGNWPEAIVG
ncbi:NAD(P)-dependent oxidoreductase [Parafrankia sp. EUN1f]|uniref:NAD-dependent epimerase/dehydratase family protein n=1 Tax=Parafrankia sp. EUN1f TaxID=102897 RepID=UPI0001C462DC|nr:NAD(P)-dependent oxidoreductase [Parafrankia sp. EUN1f]EFC82748.1 NAD-dependent epimerase/dehydratase [Parafrankia sp. EUN1f]